MSDLQKVYLFGPKRYILNKKQAIQEGYRIFRAWHSCGCCTIDMAFRTVHNVRVQFEMPKFADTVRDDMGMTHECVNTGRGFREVVQKVKQLTGKAKINGPLDAVAASLPAPVVLQSSAGLTAPF